MNFSLPEIPPLVLTDKEALELGMTHHASFWGIPLYVGNLEFMEHEAVEIAVKYRLTNPLFNLLTFVNWLFTPPNYGITVWIGGEIEGA
jgi:hypothetical protein